VTQSHPAGSRPPKVDWEGWDSALRQFAAATGLTVSAYDAQGKRHLGPFISSRVGALLASSHFWSETGRGTQLERDLVARSVADGRFESGGFCDELCVRCAPLTQFGSVHGAVVYGWNFSSFASSMGCNRIAKEAGLPGPKLWHEARLEPPVPPARMAIYTDLLKTMIASTARQTEAIERLNELSRMREVFLATVSHEMRTPLTALSLRVDILLRGRLDDPESLRAALTAMKGQVAQETRIVEDLIDAAQTRTGQLTIKPQAVSLGGVLRGALAAVELQAENKQVSLEIRDPDLCDRVHVWADAQRLQQLFWNLLSNAVKFTPAGGSVEVRVNPGASVHEIEVRDSGQGIDERSLADVFAAFNKQREGNEKGLGLGLFIAKHIADLHGGSLRAASPGIGKGATFTVTLPHLSRTGHQDR
jgi:signal transduction histidine kinase